MSERLPEPAPPRTTYPPVEPAGDVAHRNVVLGVALFALSILIAGGAVAISFVYLHYH